MNVNPFSYLIEKLKGKVDKSGDTMSGGLKVTAGGLEVCGRVYNSGDDEGIVVKPASNNLAGLILGSNNGKRSVFYCRTAAATAPEWNYVDGNNNSSVIYHPAKSGTIALMSDIYKGSVSVTADGVKKYNELFNELFALVDMSKISSTSYMTSSSSNYVFNYVNRSSANIVFSEIDPTTNGYTVGFMILASSVSDCDFVSYTTSTAGTTSKISSANSVAPNGRKITLYY